MDKKEQVRKSVLQAAEVLKKGGIVVFPTETAFGVGCRIDKPESIRRLISWRKREEGKPFLVLVADLAMAKKYWEKLPEKVENLAKRFWPGPLTIVWFCKKELVRSEVRAGGKTLGIRVPGYELTRKLVELVGIPILAPSANFSGQPAPFKISEVDPKFLEGVDFFFQAPCGKWKEPTTVLDCTKQPWKVVREGAIRRGEIF